MGTSVIIAAAGSGQRMGGIDKILAPLLSLETIGYSLLAFDEAKCTEKIVVVTSDEKIEVMKALINRLQIKTETEVVLGSSSRQKSVKAGLNACEDSEYVMIHDAARPMIPASQIDAFYEILKEKKAAALGVKVKDTIKIADKNGKILSTPDRNTLFAIQTPQGFDMKLYKKAFETAEMQDKEYTDDCQLVEAVGESVYIVEGSYENIKITTPEDLITAENFLKERKTC